MGRNTPIHPRGRQTPMSSLLRVRVVLSDFCSQKPSKRTGPERQGPEPPGASVVYGKAQQPLLDLRGSLEGGLERTRRFLAGPQDGGGAEGLPTRGHLGR